MGNETPKNDAPVTVKQIAARLVDQSDEPWPQGTTADRLHYWRDKAIDCSNRLAALASAPTGGGVEALVTELRNPWEGLPNGLGMKRGECPQWACDLMQRAANALARPRAAVGERSREEIEKAAKSLEALANWLLVNDHDMKLPEAVTDDPADTAALLRRLALQSPPAKVEG